MTLFSFQDTYCSVGVHGIPVVELKQNSLINRQIHRLDFQDVIAARQLKIIGTSEGSVLVQSNYKMNALTLFWFQDTCCSVEVFGIPVVELKQISLINPQIHRLDFQDVIAARQLKNYRDL